MWIQRIWAHFKIANVLHNNKCGAFDHFKWLICNRFATHSNCIRMYWIRRKKTSSYDGYGYFFFFYLFTKVYQSTYIKCENQFGIKSVCKQNPNTKWKKKRSRNCLAHFRYLFQTCYFLFDFIFIAIKMISLFSWSFQVWLSHCIHCTYAFNMEIIYENNWNAAFFFFNAF